MSEIILHLVSHLSSAGLAWPVLTIVMLATLGFTLGILEKGPRDTGDLTQPWPLHRRSVFSPVEKVLHFRLVRALPENMVFAQVQLSRLLGVKKGVPRRPWLNRIDRMSIDFVVCSRGGQALVAIELDDGSHARPDRVAADAKKSHALRSAGLPLVRWNVKELPDAAAIQQALATHALGAPARQAA